MDLLPLLLIAAHCVGQGDGYLISARPYNTPEGKALLRGNYERDMTQLRAAAPGESHRLENARAEGARDWDRRVAALMAEGNRMAGPAWEAHMQAAAESQAASARLREAGILHK